jgi:hypothetical protein
MMCSSEKSFTLTSCLEGLSHPCSLCLSQCLEACPALYSLRGEVVNCPLFQNFTATPVIFINQCGPGMFPRLEKILTFILLTLVYPVPSVRVRGLETWTRNVYDIKDVVS